MDRLINKLIQTAKKHRMLSVFALIGVVVLIFFKHLYEMVVRVGKMNRTKRIIAGVMAAVLVFAAAGPLGRLFGIIHVNADTVEWDGVLVDTEWYTANPSAKSYNISSAAQLAGLAQLVNSGESFYGKSVYATFESINMNFNEFTPIGTTDNPFLGTFSAAGTDGSLSVEKFYSPTAGMGLFANTHSDYINSVTSIDYDTASFTSDINGDGTDHAPGAFIDEKGVLYLPLTDLNGNYNVQYKVVAKVSPYNAWCPDVSYRIINSNDGLECTADGVITVHQAGTYEILAEALDPFTYGTATKEAVIEVVVYDRTQIESANVYADISYGTDTLICNLSDIVTSNHPERLTYSVLEDYNGAQISIRSGSQLYAKGYGTSVVLVKGFFANEEKMVNINIVPTVTRIALMPDSGTIVPGSSMNLNMTVEYATGLPAGTSVGVVPAIKIVNTDSSVAAGCSISNGVLSVSSNAMYGTINIMAEYTNPKSGNLIQSNTYIIQIVQEAATQAVPLPVLPTESQVQTGEAVNATNAANTAIAGVAGATEASGELVSEKSSENESTSLSEKVTEASEAVTENTTEKSGEGATESTTEKASEKATENATEAGTAKATERATEKTSEGLTESTTEGETKASENASQSVTEEQTEAQSSDKHQKETEAAAEEATEAAEDAEAAPDTAAEDTAAGSSNTSDIQPEAAESENEAVEENVYADENAQPEVLSDEGSAYASGYDGTVAAIYYDRFYKITGNVEDGYTVSLYAKIAEGTQTDVSEADYYDVSSYDDNGNGTFAYFVSCNADVTYLLNVTLAGDMYSWDKTAYVAENGQIVPLTVTDTQTVNEYSIQVPMGVLSGDRTVMITKVTCKDASISKVYIGDNEYTLEETEEGSNTYIVNVPYGSLPDNTDNISFNAHETAQVVKSTLFTAEDGSVYMTVTVIPIDAALESKVYTIYFVQESNTQADITSVTIGDYTIDFTTDTDKNSTEEITGGNLYKGIFEGNVTNNITINTSPYAQYSIEKTEIDTASGKIILRVVVTAQDGVTVKRHTIMLKNNGTLAEIVPGAGDITYTQEDVDAIVSALLGKTYSINQKDVSDGTLDSVRSKADILVRQSLGSQITEPLEVRITDISYLPAQEGSSTNKKGTNGSYVFSVTINSGDITSVAVGVSLTIVASEYTTTEIDYVIAENGKVTVVLTEPPTEIPDLKKFSGSIKINDSLVGYYSLYNELAEYDPSTYTVTFYPHTIAKLEYAQNVTVYVSYDGGQAVEAPMYTVSAMEQCEKPVVSLEPGEYDRLVSVEISTKTEGATIYYTLDCSEPTKQSRVYNGPIQLPAGMFGDSKTTVIRAIAVKDGMTKSSELLATYVVCIPYGTRTAGIEYANGGASIIAADGLDKLFDDPMVYTDADKAAVAAGGSVTLWLQVSDTSIDSLISGGGQDAIDANRLSMYCNTDKYTIESLYKINLLKKVTDTSGNSYVTQISSFSNGVSVTLSLTDNQQKNSKIKVVRVHNGQVDALSDIDGLSEVYTFSTDRMSIFALGNYAKTSQVITNPGPVITNNSGNSGNQEAAQPQTEGTTQAGETQEGVSQADGAGNQIGNADNQNGDNASGNNAGDNSSNSSDSKSDNGRSDKDKNTKGGNKTADNAKTGDKSPIALFAAVLIISVIIMAVLFVTGRRNNKK